MVVTRAATVKVLSLKVAFMVPKLKPILPWREMNQNWFGKAAEGLSDESKAWKLTFTVRLLINYKRFKENLKSCSRRGRKRPSESLRLARQQQTGRNLGVYRQPRLLSDR